MKFNDWWEKYCASSVRVFVDKAAAQHIYEAGQASAIAENKAEYNLGVRDGFEKAREQAAEIAEQFDSPYDLTGDELMRRGDAALEVAAAIRGMGDGRSD